MVLVWGGRSGVGVVWSVLVVRGRVWSVVVALAPYGRPGPAPLDDRRTGPVDVGRRRVATWLGPSCWSVWGGRWCGVVGVGSSGAARMAVPVCGVVIVVGVVCARHGPPCEGGPCRCAGGHLMR